MRSIPRTERILLLLASIAITTAITVGDTENAIKEPGTSFVESVKTVQVGDIKMAYQVLDQGEPLVMITGLNAAMDL